MKTFLTILFLVCTNLVQAKSFPLPMAISFLNKNHACKVAIGINDLSEFEMRHNHDQLYYEKTMGLGKEWIEGFNQMIGIPRVLSVLCVQDLIHGEGTINEAKGCTLTSYDMDTNQYGRDMGFSIKKCDNGGYQDLQSKASQVASEYVHYALNGELREPVSIFNMKYFSFIYSENKNTENAFLPHLFIMKPAPVENITKWKKWIATKNTIKESHEKVRAKEKDDAEKEESKTQQKADKKRKNLEKLYE